MYDNQRVQWTLTATIFHVRNFGRAFEVTTETAGRPSYATHDTIGTWQGVGVPVEVYRGILTSLDAIVADLLTSRYGVREQLQGWEVEVDPF
jgi:hypothetical protein